MTSKIAVLSGDYSAKTIIKVIKKTTFRTNSHARVSQDYTNRAGKWNDLKMTPMTQPLQPTHGTQPTKIVLLKGPFLALSCENSFALRRSFVLALSRSSMNCGEAE